MQMKIDSYLNHLKTYVPIINYLSNSIVSIWQQSYIFRIICSIGAVYYLGYYRVAFPIILIIGYMAYSSHTLETKRYKTKLEAKYLNLALHPELIHSIIPNLPRWTKYTGWEKAKFLNRAVEIWWPYLSMATEKLIRDWVGPLLDDVKPLFLTKLELSIIDFGKIPIRILSVRVAEKADIKDEIHLDLEIEFKGGDASFGIKAGNKLVSIGAILQDIEISGTCRIVFSKLWNDWPTFDQIRFTFIEEPVLNYSLTAVKVPLSRIPGFVQWLNGLIQNSLSEYLVWPHELIIPIGYLDEHTNTYVPPEPKGLLRVTIIEAKHLINKEIFGKSDPIAKISVNKTKFSTKKISSALNPVWHESFEFTIMDKNTDKVHCIIENYNISRKNDSLGTLSIDLSHLEENQASNSWFSLEGVMSGSVHIELLYTRFLRRRITKEYSHSLDTSDFLSSEFSEDMRTTQSQSASVELVGYHSPVLKQLIRKMPAVDERQISFLSFNDNISPDKKIPKFAKTIKSWRQLKKRESTIRAFDGILTIKVISAVDLLGTDRNGLSDPYAIIKIGNRKRKTNIKQKTLNPVWNESFQYKISHAEIMRSNLEIIIKDHDNWGKNEFLGSIELHLFDVITKNATHHRNTYMLEGVKKGSINIELELLLTAEEETHVVTINKEISRRNSVIEENKIRLSPIV